MTFGSSLHPTFFFVGVFLYVGWSIGVLSFQEKPELYSRNLAAVLHPFCTQSPVLKKTSIVFIYSERETLTSEKKKHYLTEVRVDRKSMKRQSPAKA